MQKLPDPSNFDVVFVIGLHKSGTSLFTEQLSGAFLDTSRETNPNERGYGMIVPRYFTRECSIVRQINDLCRPHNLRTSCGTGYEQFTKAQIRDKMERYLSKWGQPIIVKAPFFAYSLDDWLNSARQIKKKPCVCHIQRDLSEVVTEWENAPFTQKLLRDGELERLNAAITHQIAIAKAASIDVRSFNYTEIANSPTSKITTPKDSNP